MTRHLQAILCLLAVTAFLAALQPGTAEARGLLQWGSETVIKVADFPDEPAYQMDDGTYVDAGAIYKTVYVVFCPVWNYDMRWAGYVGTDDTFLPMEEQELRDLAVQAGVTLPDKVELPFWETIGGKLVVGGVIFILILVQLLRARSKPPEQGA